MNTALDQAVVAASCSESVCTHLMHSDLGKVEASVYFPNNANV